MVKECGLLEKCSKNFPSSYYYVFTTSNVALLCNGLGSLSHWLQLILSEPSEIVTLSGQKLPLRMSVGMSEFSNYRSQK